MRAHATTQEGTQPTPLHVLVLTHSARLGGAELALARLCEALPDHVLLRVVTFEEGALVARLRAFGVSVEVISARGRWVRRSRADTRSLAGRLSMILGTAAHAARVARRVRELDPDVVQSWTLKSHLIAAFSRPAYRAASVWFVHDRLTEQYLGRMNRTIARLLLRTPSVVVANSHATAATTGRDCLVAYPGLSAGQFRTTSEVANRHLHLPPTLLVLGRVSPTKGQHQVIKAMKEISARYPGARLRLVGAPLFGEESYEQECRSLVGTLGLNEAVTFVGQVDDPAPELDRASALIHSSELPEPFGQVVTEAMARGVPVIATERGGIPEILVDEEGITLGRMVPPSDASAIVKAVVDLVEQPSTTLLLAQAAHRRASQEFTIERTVQVMLTAWGRAQRLRPAPTEFMSHSRRDGCDG